MADNIAVTPGTGATVAADDIGGVLFQRVKIGVGTDGSATDVSSANPMPSKILMAPGTARQLTTSGTSANTALTAGIKAVSIYARTSDARFSIGNTSQTASSSSHFIASGERLDFDVSGYATPNIGIIHGPSAANANLEISELS